MKYIALLPLLLILNGCISTKTAGGYDVYGTIIDTETNKPVEGVSVHLHYWANGMNGDNSKIVGRTYTDTDGKFFIPNPQLQLWGGTGGLSGRVNKWPSIEYSKSSYCQTGRMFRDVSIEDYQNIKLKIEKKNDINNCL